MESQEIVNDIDNILKLKIPQKYLQVLNGKNYETFEKRLDYITVSSKQEFSELKRAEQNDNFKTTDECLDFMIEIAYYLEYSSFNIPEDDSKKSVGKVAVLAVFRQIITRILKVLVAMALVGLLLPFISKIFF